MLFLKPITEVPGFYYVVSEEKNLCVGLIQLTESAAEAGLGQSSLKSLTLFHITGMKIYDKNGFQVEQETEYTSKLPKSLEIKNIDVLTAVRHQTGFQHLSQEFSNICEGALSFADAEQRAEIEMSMSKK